VRVYQAQRLREVSLWDRAALRRARPSAARVDHDVHGGVGCGWCDRETGGVAECDGEDFV